MEPLADAGGFLLLRANLARSLEGGIPCLDRLRAAARWTKTEPCALPFAENSRRNLRNRTCWPLRPTQNLLLFQKVSEETLAAIHAAGYDYQGGAVIPRPGKETNNGGIAVSLFLFQLSEPSKKARPPGRIIPAINMK